MNYISYAGVKDRDRESVTRKRVRQQLFSKILTLNLMIADSDYTKYLLIFNRSFLFFFCPRMCSPRKSVLPKSLPLEKRHARMEPQHSRFGQFFLALFDQIIPGVTECCGGSADPTSLYPARTVDRRLARSGASSSTRGRRNGGLPHSTLRDQVLLLCH